MVDNCVEIDVEVVEDGGLLLGVGEVHPDERIPAFKPELGFNYQR